MKKIILILSLLAFTGTVMQTNAEVIRGGRVIQIKVVKHHKKVHHKKHHHRKRR